MYVVPRIVASFVCMCIRTRARTCAIDESTFRRTYACIRACMHACAHSSDKRTATPVEFTNSSTFSSYLRSRPQEPFAPVLRLRYFSPLVTAASMPQVRFRMISSWINYENATPVLDICNEEMEIVKLSLA